MKLKVQKVNEKSYQFLFSKKSSGRCGSTVDQPEDDQNMALDDVFITINLQSNHEERNNQPING